MVRKKSPTPEEINRINETLKRRTRFQIQDRDSYDLAFNDYLNINEPQIEGFQTKLRNNAFDEFLVANPQVSRERLFTRARGKDLKRDRLRTAKKVVTTRKEFEKAGASEVDLKGFDTARQRVTKDILERRTFTVPARVKSRVVFAMRTSVVVRGKRQVRFRSASGQFVSSKV